MMSRPPLAMRLLVHVAVWFVAFSMAAPFAWMVLTSLKTDAEASAALSFDTLLPDVPQFSNYPEAIRSAQLGRFYLNSLLAAVVTTVLAVTHNALAGFAFSKLRFRFRSVLFLLVLTTMMLPIQVFFIFAYIVSDWLGYRDTLQGLVAPFLASGFGIFFMRQAVSSVPDALLDAGRLDGMGDFDLFWHLVRPSITPALGALAIFTFMFSWNSFFWPLIIVDSVENKTLPLAIADLTSGLYVQSWPVTMAAGTLLTLPLIILFFFTQRAFVRGVALTGLKE